MEDMTPQIMEQLVLLAVLRIIVDRILVFVKLASYQFMQGYISGSNNFGMFRGSYTSGTTTTIPALCYSATNNYIGIE